jgi:hypothetical protein
MVAWVVSVSDVVHRDAQGRAPKPVHTLAKRGP